MKTQKIKEMKTKELAKWLENTYFETYFRNYKKAWLNIAKRIKERI